jgi:hypothetical protein
MWPAPRWRLPVETLTSSNRFAISGPDAYLTVLLRSRSTFKFCLPTTAAHVPDRPVWLHEVKYDGYRVRLEREGNRACPVFLARLEPSRRELRIPMVGCSGFHFALGLIHRVGSDRWGSFSLNPSYTLAL